MNFSPEKLLLVGIIALVVLGPNRLPQAARTAGRFLAELRRLSANMQHEVTSALAEPRDALHQAVGDLGLQDVRSSIRSTFAEAVHGTPTGPVSRAGTAGAPIVDPSVPLELPTPPLPATAPGTEPGLGPPPPDDPSLN